MLGGVVRRAEVAFPPLPAGAFAPRFADDSEGATAQLETAGFWLDCFASLAPRTDFFETALLVVRGMLSSINGTHTGK